METRIRRAKANVSPSRKSQRRRIQVFHGIAGAASLAQQKELGSRAECFESLTVVLQPSYSCSITSF
jgi:hypothetical protein